MLVSFKQERKIFVQSKEGKFLNRVNHSYEVIRKTFIFGLDDLLYEQCFDSNVVFLHSLQTLSLMHLAGIPIYFIFPANALIGNYFYQEIGPFLITQIK